MSYTKTQWVNNNTPINDTNLNKIEQGIYDNSVNIDTLQTQITAVASGSPAGVYSNVSALTTADPDHSKIYVVSADGHWYYYGNSQWNDGGVYQSTSIDNDSISFDNIKNNLNNAIANEVISNTNPTLNKIINTLNIEYAFNGFDHTDKIDLKAGETINVETISGTDALAQYVSVIAKVNTDKSGNVTYTSIVPIIVDNVYHEYSYTAPINSEIIVSYKHNGLKNLYISKNYTMNSVNNKLNYYYKNQRNLISDNDDYYNNSNTTINLVNNSDNTVYKKILNVNISFSEVVSNFKYNLIKKFEIPTSEVIKDAFAYIDIRKTEGDDVPCFLEILNSNFSTLVYKEIKIDNSEFKRYYVQFYSQNGTTTNFPLYFGIIARSGEFPNVTSLSSNLEIREMGIIFHKKIYNTQENMFTPYDLQDITKDAGFEKGIVSIIGDSYSTYDGWLPDNYVPWYSDSGNVLENNVDNVNQTWWYKLIEDLKATLLINNSYSGSTICNTGYNGADSTSTSFITRMKKWNGEDRKLDPKPNLIIIMGGTNDTWADSPVGSLKYSSWTNEDLKQVLPAFCYMLYYLKKWNPGATIVNVVNTDISSSIKTGMQTACEYYGIINVTPDVINKDSGHPNKNGMIQIKNAIEKNIHQEI